MAKGADDAEPSTTASGRWKPFKQEDVANLKELIDAGNIAPVIDRRYPLAGVADALRYLEAGQAMGKIVITVGGPEGSDRWT